MYQRSHLWTPGIQSTLRCGSENPGCQPPLGCQPVDRLTESSSHQTASSTIHSLVSGDLRESIKVRACARFAIGSDLESGSICG